MGLLANMGYVGVCGSKGYDLFSRFGHKQCVDFGFFWSQIEYGFCTLVLKWVCFFWKELSTRQDQQQKPFTLPLTSILDPIIGQVLNRVLI